MDAICSSAVEKSISGNSACTSASVMPLSSSDWICMSMAMYSVIAPSSMAEVRALISARIAGFSLSEAALYSRSFWFSRSTSDAAFWTSSCSQTGATIPDKSCAYSIAAFRRSSTYFALSASIAA